MNKLKENLSLFKRLYSYMKNMRSMLFFTLLFAVLSGLMQLFIPMQIGIILDAFNAGDFEQFKTIGILGLIYLFSFLSEALLRINVTKLSNRVSTGIRDHAFAHLTKLPMDFFDRADQGDIISRMTNDVSAIAVSLEKLFQELLSGIVIFIGSLVLMYSMNWIVATIVVVLTPLSFVITGTIALGSNKLFYRQSQVTGELQAYAEEIINGQKQVKAYAGEEEKLEIYNALNEKLYEVGQKAQFMSSLTNPGTRLVNNITYVVVGVISVMLSALGKLSIGEISAFLNYALQYAKPVNQIAQVMTEIQQGLASSQRIFELIDLPEEDSDEKLPEIEFKQGEVEFSHIGFAYEKTKPLIQDLNLHIKAGQRVAIVGPTGAGKTTLVNLLMRFYEPKKGAIYVDKQDIAQYTRNSVRAMFGMVLQDTWLLKSSIKDNIAYGKDGATAEEVITAAKNAQAHDFIMQLENGYDTKLENVQSSISSGQKQLLTLARVFISNPDILILDEATSDIDTRTEILVQDAFNKLMLGRTSFIIAHRLSTIKDADLILVMNQGDVIETGTHEELLAKRGFYYDLYYSQFA